MKKFLLFVWLFAAIAPKAFAGPYISATPQVLNSFNYTTGAGPSASQTVILQSAIMAVYSGSVTVTSPADYELSLNNSSFGSMVTIPYSGDTLAATRLYVRLKSGLIAGAYMNESIGVVATGVSQTIMASGLVTSPCVITPGMITNTSASFTWTATGAASYECKIDQAAADPASGSAAATASYTQGNLIAGTNYYFHVRGVGPNNNFTGWTTQAFKTAGATGIANVPGKALHISLSPNPNHGVFTLSGVLDSKSNGPVTIVVMNAIGQIVYSAAATSEHGKLSKAIQLTAPAGMYAACVSAEAEYSVVRFDIAP